MATQLNEITSPMGRRRENPFQSCLDLDDRSMLGKYFTIS